MISRLDVRPTRRGYAVAAIAVVSFAALFFTGESALHAVAVPAVGCLVVAAVQLWTASPPSVSRSAPEAGFPGERREVRATVEPSLPCVVAERIGEGLGYESTFSSADQPPPTEVGHDGTFEYEVELGGRGAQPLGPARCRQTDSLGLFARTREAGDGSSVLVYPALYEVGDELLAEVVARRLGPERGSFDRLREYVDGDTMRDVHWKASAKRPEGEFVVVEHEDRVEDDAVRIVAESDEGSADAMATAAASLALDLRDAGVDATVVLPGSETVERGASEEHLLRTLALAEGGSVADRRRTDADVRIAAENGRATVTVADRDVDFESAIAGTTRRVTA